MTKIGSKGSWDIYALLDPFTNHVRYVGCTTNARSRMRSHMYENSVNREKIEWVRSLRNDGKSPVMSILETGSGDGWIEAEIRWISEYSSTGFLLNKTIGGLGRRPETSSAPMIQVAVRMGFDLHREACDVATQRGMSFSELVRKSVDNLLCESGKVQK